jgi:hypothetical protein
VIVEAGDGCGSLWEGWEAERWSAAVACYPRRTMFRQDYILRLIEQFGRALAALLAKIIGRQLSPAEVHAQIAVVAAQSGLSLDVARGLDPAMLLMWLAPRGDIDPGKFWLMAELLYLEGVQAREEGDDVRARADLERARVLLLKLEPDWRPQADLASARERLAEVESALGIRES